MKVILLSAALLSVTPASAPAQTAKPAATPTSAPVASLNGDSPVEAIAATPAGKAAIEKNIPGVLGHPAYEQFKGMSLRTLAPLSGGIVTEEKIAAMEADLKAAK